MGTVLQEEQQNDYCIKEPDVALTRSGFGCVHSKSKINIKAMTTTTTTTTTTTAAISTTVNNNNNNTYILISPTPSITSTNLESWINACEEESIGNCGGGGGGDGGDSGLQAKPSVLGVFALNSDFNHHASLVAPQNNPLGRSKLIFPTSSSTSNNNNNATITSTTITNTTTNTGSSSTPTCNLQCCIKVCETGKRWWCVVSSNAGVLSLNRDEGSLKYSKCCEGSLLYSEVPSESLIMTPLKPGFAVTTTSSGGDDDDDGGGWSEGQKGFLGLSDSPHSNLNYNQTNTMLLRLCCYSLPIPSSPSYEPGTVISCPCYHHNLHLHNSHQHHHHQHLHYHQHQHHQQHQRHCRHHHHHHHHHHHKVSNDRYVVNCCNNNHKHNAADDNNNNMDNNSYKNHKSRKIDNNCVNNNNIHTTTTNTTNHSDNTTHTTNTSTTNTNNSHITYNNHTTTTNNTITTTTTTTNNNTTTATANNYNNDNHTTTNYNSNHTTNNNKHTTTNHKNNNHTTTTNTHRNHKPQSFLFTLYHKFISTTTFLHSVFSSYNVIFVAFTMFFLAMLPTSSHALHLQGVWKSDDFFLFLAKFGFQKTDLRDLEHTQGIIYGQIFSHNKTPLSTASQHSPSPMLTLVLVDSEYFMEYYGNRTSQDTNRCSQMFNKIDTIAFDYKCQPKGLEDFLRKVPCSENQICIDEDDPKDVIDGFQFTYRIRDLERPRFWYLSLAGCHRNNGHEDQNKSIQCEWLQSPKDIEIAYDIWLVNGHPSMKHINPFEHQFSFELHDVAEIYLIALLLYCILLGTWLRACNKLIKHPVTKLLTLTIVLETLGILLNCVHVIKFAFDGIGVNWLAVVGNGIDVLSECLFMLLVLVIAKGWAITSMYLEGKWVIFSVWGLYTVLNAVLFVWNLTEIDIISNTGEWHTGPGYLTLVFRLTIMLWFLYELRWTFLNDPQSKRLLFFQHFGAGILVWFVYLPVLVMVSLQISALWRYKTILSISFAANFLSAVCIVHLLWPSHSVLYLIKQDELIGAYEMEVTGFLEEPDNSSVPQEVLEEEPFEKLSKQQNSSSLLKTLSKKNGQISSEDKELLLD